MTDIPASILQIATTAVKEISSRMEDSPSLGAAATEIIARAILDERERCADIADELEQPGIPGSPEWFALGNFAAKIRDAIRSGEQP